MRREIGQALTAPAGAHPWPAVLPSSRFGQLPPRPVAYTPVEPLVVVEIDADTAMEQDRWRHATVFRRLRPDLRVDDIATSTPT